MQTTSPCLAVSEVLTKARRVLVHTHRRLSFDVSYAYSSDSRETEYVIDAIDKVLREIECLHEAGHLGFGTDSQKPGSIGMP